MRKNIIRVILGILLIAVALLTYTKWRDHMTLRNFDYLEKFYPTKDLRELFKYFPEDFAVIHIREFAEEGKPGQTISIRIIIEGESKTQKISAKAILKKNLPDGSSEILEKIDLTYKGGVSFDIPKDKQISTYLNNFELLMAHYDYRAEDFAQAKPLEIYDNPVHGSYERRYHFETSDSISSDYGVDFSKSKYEIEFGKSLSRIGGLFKSTIGIRTKDSKPISNEARTMIFCSETISAIRSQEVWE